MFPRSILMFAVLAASGLYAQVCPVKPAAPPFHQSVPGTINSFEWYSAYGLSKTPGNGNDYERSVHNTGAKLLKYTWPVGRMYDFALPPGQTDSICINYGRPKPERGDLHFGRMDDAVQTSVWEGEAEPAAKSIISRFIFFFSKEGGDDPEGGLVLQSSVEEGKYTYRLKNISRETVRISWTVNWEVSLFEQLNQPSRPLRQYSAIEFGKMPESALADQLKKGKILEPGQAISFSISSGSKPVRIDTNLDVGSVDGRPLAGAILSILVPGR